MNVRKTIRHYGNLGGRHRDRTKDVESLDPTSELGVRTCPQCRKSQYEHESYKSSLGRVEYHRCMYCGGTFLHREDPNQ